MSELGRLLREARTAKEHGLADVESATRIRQKYLEALESGDFAKLPRGTVARGFLRTYASFLGLDVEEMLRRYGKESGDVGADLAIAEPGKPRLADYRPLEVTLSEPVRSFPWWTVILAALLVIAIIATVLWWLNRTTGFNLLAAFSPAPTATATATHAPTATRWVVTATPKPEMPTAEAAQPTPTSDLLPLPMPTVPATLTPTPRPTATPEVVSQIDLTLKILRRAWVRVTVDGQIAEENTFEAGSERDWQATESISVRTGNGGGVSLTLNGEDLGAMGDIGKVVERTWVIDQAGVTEQTLVTPAKTPAPTATPTPSGVSSQVTRNE